MNRSIPFNKDFHMQIQNQVAKFSSGSQPKQARRFNQPSSAMNQRRTAALNKANNVLAIQKADYYSAQNQRSNLPSSLNGRLNSNKSGPIQHSTKISRKQKRDKASYEYFISIASRSLAKGLKD